MVRRRNLGITIDIEGNTKPLQKALGDVDKASRQSEAELRKINRALKFDEGNTTLLAQQFEVLEETVQNTANRLDVLRRAKADVDREFAAGNIDASAYREFNREIEITENRLERFKSQADNIRVRIEADVNLNGINRLRNAIQQLPQEAKQAGSELGANLSQGAAGAVAGLSALSIGFDDTSKQLSRFDSIADNAVSTVNNLGNNVKKLSDEELSNLQDSLSEQEDALRSSFDGQLEAIERSYDQREAYLERSLENEIRALEDSQEQKLRLIDEEYEARLKLVDEDERNRLRAIDSQIEGIRQQQDAADAALRLEEEQQKRLELQSNINNASTNANREKAVRALADFESRILQEREREERQAQIESLQSQKDIIRESADEQRDSIRSEQELRISQLNEAYEYETDRINQIQNQKREQFAQQRDDYIKSVREQYDEEFKLYQDLNKRRIEEAEKPVNNTNNAVRVPLELDVGDFRSSRVIFDSVRQDVDQSVEAIGNLVQAGFQSEKDLEEISRGIAGAIQFYGDGFSAEGLGEGILLTTQLGEANGQLLDLLERSGIPLENFNDILSQYATVGERANFISETLANQGLNNIYNTFEKTNDEIIKSSEANIDFIDALDELNKALIPLITIVTQVITEIAKFAAENPVLTQSLLVVLGVITALAGAFAVLAPIITSIISLASALGVGIATVLTPIGYVIAAVGAFIALAGLLTAAWEPITDFFKGLWDGIVNGFEYSVDLIKTLLSGILEFIKAPINYLIEGVNDLIRGINKIKIPDNIPVIGGAGFNFPTIPKFARGTDYFRGGLALVGEEGPELVNLPRGSAVNTARETNDLLGGGININVSSLVVREEADIQRIARELYRMYQVEQRGR